LEAGIGPDDSLTPLIEALAALPEDCEGVFDKLDARLTTIAEQAEKQASGRVANIAIGEVSRSIDLLVVQRYRQGIYLAFAIMVGCLLVGVGTGYWLRGGGSLINERCQIQDHGIACSGWRVPPPS